MYFPRKFQTAQKKIQDIVDMIEAWLVRFDDTTSRNDERLAFGVERFEDAILTKRATAASVLRHAAMKSRRAAAGRAKLLANSSSTTGGISKVEQIAPLRHGSAAWSGF